MTLQQFFKQVPKAALAFSGGTDSSYLLYEAVSAKCDVQPYYIKTAFQPEFEFEDAKRLCAQLGVGMKVVALDVFSDPVIAANTSNRCYFCKRSLFGRLAEAAAADGYDIILDGTNASDDFDDRPGMKALAELKVLSPLRECGLTKAEIRERSKDAGLFTWDKPAYACLATRVPTNMMITPELLNAVEESEKAMFEMGFSDFRVRVTPIGAKIQIPSGQFSMVADNREKIVDALSPFFGEICLDLYPR